MKQSLKIGKLEWIDATAMKEEETIKLLQSYDFHELDIEACLESNQHDRVDTYPKYLFIVMHFPKYNSRTQSYEVNEFNVFIKKNLLITFKKNSITQIDKIFEKYSEVKKRKLGDFKLTPGYILYEIIQAMLEKMFKVNNNIKKDLREIEKTVFEKTSSGLVKQIMTKKRNIVVLKHMFLPQVSVLKSVENKVNILFKGDMEVYFEDLEDKLDHVIKNIRILEEYADNIEDAFKSIIDIRTGNIITFLTIFSAFMLPLTFITSLYGMNIPLPFENNPVLIYSIIAILAFAMVVGVTVWRKKGKF
ncbi:magnesium transporter CorA family protein [Candidatus Gracilibacteria bacterium]|nr:magnesium transporter CorA family protein [Candidatus Gracilibacteria bacterium]